MSAVLVTGGAGYVGSHVVRRLRETGREVVVVDDLSQGHRAAVGDTPLIAADFGDPGILDDVLSGGKVRFVVHLAASTSVAESMGDPSRYFRNNLTRSLTLLDSARRHDVRGTIFSSSAAVYGDPLDLPITEEHPLRASNPYGETKLAVERALSWYHRAYGTRYVTLRYFNAAGAHPEGDLGEDHEPETHLIPRLLRSVQAGGPPTPLFGDDYPTTDGTCVRDFVHVLDIADAHVRALDALERGDLEAEAFNLGSGEGFSVREVVEMVARVTGAPPAVERAPRRAGDPAILVASSDRAQRRLGWRRAFPSLESIVRTAWAWHQRHPSGFAG